MKFTKVEGLANDFVMTHELDTEAVDRFGGTARSLCDRRRGIGADGVIFVLPPSSSSADFRMRILNADGGEAEMCGNGIRCFARYVNEQALSDKGALAIETGAGLIRTWREGDLVRVDMGAPVLDADKIPTAGPAGERIVRKPIEVEGRRFEVTAVSMGNPHAVIHVDDITDELVLEWGARLERHPFFPKRTNVEFVSVLGPAETRMRVFERGCGETAACGTGACASVVAGVLTGVHGTAVTVHLNGGDLKVSWDGEPEHHVFMTGPSRTVFTGEVPIDA